MQSVAIKRFTRSNVRRELLRQDKIVRAEMVKELTDASLTLAVFFGLAVKRWRNKPKFTPAFTLTPDLLVADINLSGKKKAIAIWNWIDKGTGLYGPKKAKYPITPKRPGYPLKFQSGYSAITQPVARINVGSGKSSGPTVRTMKVMHPGIKARKFTETAEDILTPPLKRRMENALRRASRKIK